MQHKNPIFVKCDLAVESLKKQAVILLAITIATSDISSTARAVEQKQGKIKGIWALSNPLHNPLIHFLELTY